jgi:hypothetical protein
VTDAVVKNGEPSDLESVIDLVLTLCDHNDKSQDCSDRVTIAEILEAIGDRSFGPLLLVPSLIALSPVGAIPGLPAFTSAVEIIVAVQMLAGRKHFWIPGWLARRSIDLHKLQKGLSALRPGAVFVDHTLLRPRLAVLTRGPFLYAIAVLCLIVALITPVLELIPFIGGIPPNAAVVAFSLSITARDGLWAILAAVFTVASIGLMGLAL